VNRVIFLHTGWMQFYNGIDGDSIERGGRHVDQYGWGGEIFNFKPYRGRLHGCVAPPRDWTIDISRCGASDNDKHLDGVTVIWTATRPGGGVVIVGWYRDARLYRRIQERYIPGRVCNNEPIGYFVLAKERNACLLPVDERVVQVRVGKGWKGQSGVAPFLWTDYG
jgi:5-methylcytosine-specific restriction protein A